MPLPGEIRPKVASTHRSGQSSARARRRGGAAASGAGARCPWAAIPSDHVRHYAHPLGPDEASVEDHAPRGLGEHAHEVDRSHSARSVSAWPTEERRAPCAGSATTADGAGAPARARAPRRAPEDPYSCSITTTSRRGGRATGRRGVVARWSCSMLTATSGPVRIGSRTIAARSPPSRPPRQQGLAQVAGEGSDATCARWVGGDDGDAQDSESMRGWAPAAARESVRRALEHDHGNLAVGLLSGTRRSGARPRSSSAHLMPLPGRGRACVGVEAIRLHLHSVPGSASRLRYRAGWFLAPRSKPRQQVVAEGLIDQGVGFDSPERRPLIQRMSAVVPATRDLLAAGLNITITCSCPKSMARRTRSACPMTRRLQE